MSSYLQNRNQYVFIDGVDSTYKNIICGVPQGSVLGPLLYCIYVLNLKNINFSLNSRYFTFADDTAFVFLLIWKSVLIVILFYIITGY